MTDDRVALFELLDRRADDDFVREMLSFAAHRLMELQAEAKTGAAHAARSADWTTHRNGYRERSWEARSGTID
jgi:transposase-like protein